MINGVCKQSSKQLMSVMLFCSAVLLAGCGGAGDADAESSSLTNEETTSVTTTTTRLSSDFNTESTTDAGSTTAERTEETVTLEDSSTVTARRSTEDSTTGTESTDDSTVSLDDFVIQSDDSSLEDTNSVTDDGGTTSNNDDSVASDDSGTTVLNTTYTANIQWNAPAQRENGTVLNLYEIAGYEVQYRKVGAPNFTVVRVAEDGSGTQSLTIEVSADSDYELLIASYDIDGLYSDYYQARIEDVASLIASGS